MDKIDKLIKRIDEEIARNRNRKIELKLESAKGRYFPNLIEIIDTNVEYLEVFKAIAIEIKEEK